MSKLKRATKYENGTVSIGSMIDIIGDLRERGLLENFRQHADNSEAFFRLHSPTINLLRDYFDENKLSASDEVLSKAYRRTP